MKTYFILASYNIRSQLKYPLDFTIQMIIWFIYALVPFLAIALLMQQFPVVGEWDIYKVAFSYGIIGASYDFARLLGRGFDNFHAYTKSGQLDVFYIRPSSLIVQVVGNNVFLRRIAGILNYILILIFAYRNLMFDFNVGLTIISITTLFVAMFILFFSLLLLYATTCLFTIDRNGFSDVVVDRVFNLSFLPISEMPKVLLIIFVYIIPIYFIFYTPINSLFLGANNVDLILKLVRSLSIAVLFFIISTAIFKKSLSLYSSTGN